MSAADAQVELEALLARRILILDGAMGSMIQRYGLAGGLSCAGSESGAENCFEADIQWLKGV